MCVRLSLWIKVKDKHFCFLVQFPSNIFTSSITSIYFRSGLNRLWEIPDEDRATNFNSVSGEFPRWHSSPQLSITGPVLHWIQKFITLLKTFQIMDKEIARLGKWFNCILVFLRREDGLLTHFACAPTVILEGQHFRDDWKLYYIFPVVKSVTSHPLHPRK